MDSLKKERGRGAGFAPLSLAFALAGAGFLLGSCATPVPQSVDPAKAVYELAPLARNAQKPAQGVYYEIFVRSFADSNKDNVGDFRGLTAKLDYLNDGNDLTTTDLGITGIWLMPVFASKSNHGYDVDDYYAINPKYGTMEDFQTFLTEARRRGISVILDMTCNHSSVYNNWFVESKNPTSPYRSWYRWVNEGDSRYNLSQKIWGHNVWNKVGDAYYSGLFVPSMPDFNLSEPAVREEFKKIAKFWMDKGVTGFRYDAAGHVYNSAKIAQGEDGQSEAIAWWKEMIGYVRSLNPDAYTVGEVWEQTGTRAEFMKGLGSTFHFDLGPKIVDAIREGDGGRNNIANSLYGDYKTYAAANPDYIDAPFLTNHDQNRISGQLKGDPAQLKLSASLYMLAEGVPFIYYGEEIGQMGAKPDDQIRTPMIWNLPGKDKYQTGWIESVYNKKTIPVALQAKDPESTLQFYKRLIRIKTAHSALYEGRMKPLATDQSAIVSWMMESATEKAFVMNNLSPDPVEVSLPAGTDMPLVFATYADTAPPANGKITISGRGCAILAASR